MNRILCDGCLVSLVEKDVEVSGKRREHFGGGGIPNGEFHLCTDCAVVAFHAAATRPDPLTNRLDLAGETYDALANRRRARIVTAGGAS